MTEEPLTDAIIRRFFLGELNEQERERLEELFITDSECRERILSSENDLIEEYLEDVLTPSDRDSFLNHYLVTPQQRRKLEIADSLKKYARAQRAEQVAASSEGNPSDSKWHAFLNVFRPRNRMVFLPIAAMLLIVTVFGIAWLTRVYRSNTLRALGNNNRLAIERELAEINSGSTLYTRHPAAKIFSIVLLPVSVRSDVAPAKISVAADNAFAELKLVPGGNEEYSSYRAELKRVGGAERITIPNLHLESGAVRVIVPLHLLTRGLYQLELSGVAADGQAETAGEYTFEVDGE